MPSRPENNTSLKALADHSRLRGSARLIRDEAIIRLARLGLSGPVIASRCGCSTTVVYYVAREAGISVHGRPGGKDGWS